MFIYSLSNKPVEEPNRSDLSADYLIAGILEKVEGILDSRIC